jgi:acyl-CoA thioesterase FadM
VNPTATVAVPLRALDAGPGEAVRPVVYLDLVETARVSWLNGLLGPQTTMRDLFVRELRIAYRDALQISDEQVLCTFLVRHSSSEEVVVEERMSTPSGRLVAQLTTALCGWDPEAEEPRPLEQPVVDVFR